MCTSTLRHLVHAQHTVVVEVCLARLAVLQRGSLRRARRRARDPIAALHLGRRSTIGLIPRRQSNCATHDALHAYVAGVIDADSSAICAALVALEGLGHGDAAPSCPSAIGWRSIRALAARRARAHPSCAGKPASKLAAGDSKGSVLAAYAELIDERLDRRKTWCELSRPTRHHSTGTPTWGGSRGSTEYVRNLIRRCWPRLRPRLLSIPFLIRPRHRGACPRGSIAPRSRGANP